MKRLKRYFQPEQASVINIQALEEAAVKYDKINALIENGKEIDPELRKNFVTFPLSDNPYKD